MKQEKNYEIIKLENNEILIAISFKQGFPEKPFLIHDGSEHAIFYRNQDEVILLDFIHKDILPLFGTKKEIMIAEVDFPTNQIIAEYKVPIKKIKEYGFKQIEIIRNKYKS